MDKQTLATHHIFSRINKHWPLITFDKKKETRLDKRLNKRYSIMLDSLNINAKLMSYIESNQSAAV